VASKNVPWRTVIHSKETGRFTEKQISDAVETVRDAGKGRGNHNRSKALDPPSKAPSGVHGDGRPSRGNQNGKR
jgi:hypothetical protein